MNKPEKEFILWIYSDGGYHPSFFDTFAEALVAEKYSSDWYITKSINKVNAYEGFEKPKPKEVVEKTNKEDS